MELLIFLLILNNRRPVELKSIISANTAKLI